MGKGAAKYGFKSGILPATRNILKKPTVRQTELMSKLTQPKQTGRNGVGYADGVLHPKGSKRVQSDVVFINVEELISKTVPLPQNKKELKSKEQKIKETKASLRREYLMEAFRNEEERLIRVEQLMKKKEMLLEQEKQAHLKELEKEKSSDLTVPTLEKLINEPLVRLRTPEEEELLNMKRKYNREVIEFKAKERKLEKLIELYHATNEFIVTEQDLIKKIDEAFSMETSDLLRTKLSLSASRIKSKNESMIGDALFGTVAGTHTGLPEVKEYISNESAEFNDLVQKTNNELENNTNS
ncbi:hypothetical protein TPHA_0J02950 [Tetrapisispora phaffii CBS 4417]|uniref:37S ribosomal protein PET123, mitochondrial n=1 Tax=Tetrapisispora phaffii (strain ATCC 24235 / CBS 4417 / NBRC 1672 / NRRL Y-8282 / UCD 70-5) TaxID=1071381 RepID=G8BY65_TETPH|nr:mitochondrial 37S ribosomal protein PET123 TPHA_0J02950 [Tetrapisispora phaffii CBS 4417]CCE65116.1 hypothetical protein TPHA_0J02950 [Tetrapisispora phaffii CBS 4417]